MISATTANIVGPLDVRSSLSRLLAGYVSDLETIQENPSNQIVAKRFILQAFLLALLLRLPLLEVGKNYEANEERR